MSSPLVPPRGLRRRDCGLPSRNCGLTGWQVQLLVSMVMLSLLAVLPSGLPKAIVQYRVPDVRVRSQVPVCGPHMGICVFSWLVAR
jgi:hypothetical protein